MNIALSLDVNSSIPLSQQLYEQLRELILLGKLRPGAKLSTLR